MNKRSCFGPLVYLATAFLVACTLLVSVPVAQGQNPTDAPAPAGSTGAPPVPSEPAPAVESVSKAEQITQLQRSIEADKERIEELREKLTAPDSQYRQIEAEFKAIDDRFAAEKADLEQANAAGRPDSIAMAETRLIDTERTWKLARSRFDLAIETRKAEQDQISALEANVEQNCLVLEQLTGDATAPRPASEPTPPAGSSPEPAQVEAAEVAAPAGTSPPPAPSPAPAALPSVPPVALEDIFVKPARAPTPELIEAEQFALSKQAAAEAAEKVVQSTADRLAALDRNLEIEQRLLQASRKKSDLANESRRVSEQEYQRKSLANASHDELREIAARLEASEAQFTEARNEVRLHTDRMNQLHDQRAELQQAQMAATAAAQAIQVELTEAQATVGKLKNPFAAHNILQWLLDHGPRLVLILVVMFLLRLIVQFATRRVVTIMVNGGLRGTPEESEDRSKTLVGVFQNAASLTIIIGGGLMICEEVGIAVAPLMGGAAVVGLAVAFGAQNLIRDYFYGFVILLENQYKINDVLRIGGISGQVERITLRMTVLRDVEGSVHFIPNGKIDSVSNLTHGWSRAVFDVRVSYREDVDHVIKVLMELAREMRYEAAYARLIIDEPEMLGVDALEESAVVIRFLLKTRPLKQWPVKRELLRRIKARFDELNIEMPYPHRTIYHRDETSLEHYQHDHALASTESHGRKRTA